MNQSIPVIPPPDGENDGHDQTSGAEYYEVLDKGAHKTVVITNRPPLRSRIARGVAWLHLVIGAVYASSLVYRAIIFFVGPPEETNLALLLIGLIVIVPLYVTLHGLIGTWCEVVNDVLLGIVNCWPNPLTFPEFFDRLKTEATLDLARSTLRNIGIPEIAAVIPHRPRLNSSARSLFYMTTYLGCFFYAPLLTFIKAAFWKVESAFVILFIAYILTNARAYREQPRR